MIRLLNHALDGLQWVINVKGVDFSGEFYWILSFFRVHRSGNSYILDVPRPLILKYNDGVKELVFFVRPHSVDYEFALVHEKYELLHWFYPSLSDGGVFVDVGAHVGGYSIRACGLVHRVIAVEPNPHSIIALEVNAKLNSCGSELTIINKALDNEVGEAWLYVRKQGNVLDSPRAFISNEMINDNSLIRFRVSIDRLDNIVNDLGLDRIDLLKVDVEGAEGNVIVGSRDSLEITKRVIIELRRDTLWIIDYLRRHNFRLVDYRWRGDYGDFFFIRT